LAPEAHEDQAQRHAGFGVYEAIHHSRENAANEIHIYLTPMRPQMPRRPLRLQEASKPIIRGHLNTYADMSTSQQRVSGEKPSLCIINYNGELCLRNSLACAVGQREKFAEILVIDDASQDRSEQIVRESFPVVKLVALESNRGPAAARNAGFKAASSDRILFVDNDVSLSDDCVDRLMEALDDNPSAVAAMPSVLYAHQKDTVQYDGADNHFLGLMILHHEQERFLHAAREVRKIGSLVTACALVDRRKITDPEPFDESFFIYFEDHDFGVRMRTLGYEILSVPAAFCFHGEGTEGLSVRRSGKYSRRTVFCLIRNRWQFILKNYSLRSLLLLLPLFFIFEISQLIIVIKKGWLVEWGRAVAWIARHLVEILQKRRKIQSARKNPDRMLFRDGAIPFKKELCESPLERVAKDLLDRVAALYWQQVQRLI
jgi:GT2 family glycosyltransferase